MKILYTTIFLISFLIISYKSYATDSLNLKVNEETIENKKNILSPVGDKVKPNTINPVLREQMSDDELNPKPVPNANHKQTEPPIGRDFIEKWEITSAKTASPGSVEPFYLLTPDSYFKFYPLNIVVVKINENFPEQQGIMTQSELSIKIDFSADKNCSNCIKYLEIRRQTVNDKYFTLIFNDMKQIISVKPIR